MNFKLRIILITFSITVSINAQINPQHVTIVRDSFGIPHIYGITDADAAYGLAWAHSEDDFKTIQENILSGMGRLGEVKGKNGAVLDFVSQMVEVKQRVQALYDTSYSPGFKKILNAYVQGLNDYARKHPDEVLLKNVFPIVAQDLVGGYMVAITLLTSVQYDLKRIFDGHITNQEAGPMANGSNAMAMNSAITEDKQTYLAINSHQPLEGAYAWYEAHINSEEGWNVLGGTFPGGICPFVGTNPNLGWAHTLNYPDLCDVFKLRMKKGSKKYYAYDGQWLALEKKKAKLKVKLGGIKLSVRKTYWTSVYGPTLKNKHGFYAMRFPAYMSIKHAEQWFTMNKAQNFSEFKKAIDMQGIPGMNVIYADKFDTIYFLCNGHFGTRNPNYDWTKVVPGDTSATLWQPQWFPVDSLPQLTNPAAGYVFNTNNTPFNATHPDQNLKASDYNKTLGMLEKDVNRSIRYQQLIKGKTSVSYADFKAFKSDLYYAKPLYTRTLENLNLLMELNPTQYPDIADVITHFQKWDGGTHITNRQAPIFSLAIQFLLKHLNDQGIVDYNNTLPESLYVESLRYAKKHLIKHFGTIDIALGDLQKHVRGTKELPMWGLPEVLCQMYTKPYKDGKLRSTLGDSYIMLIRYTEDGPIIETINCYGASNHPDSPHYTDQMEMFVNQQYKPMSLDKESILKTAKKVYHPGE